MDQDCISLRCEDKRGENVKNYTPKTVVRAAKVVGIFAPGPVVRAQPYLDLEGGQRFATTYEWLLNEVPSVGGYLVEHAPELFTFVRPSVFERRFEEKGPSADEGRSLMRVAEEAKERNHELTFRMTGGEQVAFLQRELALAVEQGNIARKRLQELELRVGDAEGATKYVNAMYEAEARSFYSLARQVMSTDDDGDNEELGDGIAMDASVSSHVPLVSTPPFKRKGLSERDQQELSSLKVYNADDEVTLDLRDPIELKPGKVVVVSTVEARPKALRVNSDGES